MFLRDWAWDRYLWMGGEGIAGQREGGTEMQTMWRLPWGVRELELSPESSPELGGVEPAL